MQRLRYPSWFSASRIRWATRDVDLGLVRQPPGRHVALAADDRFDAGLVGLLIKFHRPEHGAVIGDGHGFHAELPGPFEEPIDADGAVQQAVLGVDVEVNKPGESAWHS